MIGSKILKMKFFIYLLIYLAVRIAICDGNIRKRDISVPEPRKGLVDVVTTVEKNAKGSIMQDHDVKVNDEGKEIVNVTKPLVESTINESIQSTPWPTQSGIAHVSLNSGALLRGFYVFVGLSILVMAYIVFRSFRLNKTRAQMVRKYGILAHRQDVEMRPLPLDEEDDDDTTVFDASIVLTRESPHQNI